MTDPERAAVRALAAKLSQPVADSMSMRRIRIDPEVITLLDAAGGDEDRGYYLYKVSLRYAQLLRAKEAR